MRVLFIGDGLVKGNTGVNWVRLLERKHPEWVVENAGVCGETITNISGRLKKKIISGASYDFIVLLAGANDILLPSLEKRGYFFRKTYQSQLRKGNTPIRDIPVFREQLDNTISFLQSHSSASLILATIGCLNENLQFPLNKSRQAFNAIIRELAKEKNCRLADAAALCDGCLLRLKTNDYFLENYFNTAWLDKLRSRMPGSADALSKKRKLHLTIDGLHLNSEGARFYMDEIEKQVY
jgi:lysophospholipase L1-like esterase